MATDSFKFWDSYYDALKMAPTPEDGYRLVMSLCGYVFDGIEPDFSDNPLLGMAYMVMSEQAVQSRDISRAARENGMKARGVPKKQSSTKAPLKPPLRGAKAKRREKKREEEKGSEPEDSIKESSGALPPSQASGGRVASGSLDGSPSAPRKKSPFQLAAERADRERAERWEETEGGDGEWTTHSTRTG